MVSAGSLLAATFLFASTALSAVKISVHGEGHSGLSVTSYFTIEEDGNEICSSGVKESQEGNVECGDGKLSWNWSPIAGPFEVHYENYEKGYK